MRLVVDGEIQSCCLECGKDTRNAIEFSRGISAPLCGYHLKVLYDEKRYYIAGWGGEHDETGARIVDRKTGKIVCHTASASAFTDWTEYVENTKIVVDGLNMYAGLFER